MPDSSTLEMPGAEGGDKNSHVIMIVGAIAGVVGLVLLLKSQSGSGGTVAAGTSINAALGSIQEENMNLLGTTQAGFMQMGQQIGAASTQEANDAANTQAMLNNGFSTMATQLTSVNTSLGNQMTGLSSQVQGYDQSNQASFQNINALLAALSNDVQTGNNNSASYYANLGALMNELGTGISGVSGQVGQVSQQVSGVSTQVAGVQGTASETQLGISNIGDFLGWQFYQLPNRYATYLPGGSATNPSGIYTNYNVSGIPNQGG